MVLPSQNGYCLEEQPFLRHLSFSTSAVADIARVSAEVTLPKTAHPSLSLPMMRPAGVTPEQRPSFSLS